MITFGLVLVLVLKSLFFHSAIKLMVMEELGIKGPSSRQGLNYGQMICFRATGEKVGSSIQLAGLWSGFQFA